MCGAYHCQSIGVKLYGRTKRHQHVMPKMSPDNKEESTCTHLVSICVEHAHVLTIISIPFWVPASVPSVATSALTSLDTSN